MQTKQQSMIETFSNVGIGIVGSLLITLAVMHVIQDRTLCSFITVTLCTVWSLVRGYYIRRHFNKKVTV